MWFYNFRIGIGSLSNYIKVDVEDCNVSSNNIGIANVVDSKLILSTINANVMYGIKLSDGANDNIFSALKIEWNGENNLYVKMLSIMLFPHPYLIDLVRLVSISKTPKLF